ncbi:MAG: AEC family transporter [Anaerolineae bacterium]|jgi:hypothetical protein
MLINVVLPVFVVAGLTALAQTWLRLESRTLSRAVFYLFAPALVFDSLTGSEASGAQFGRIALVVLATTAVLWLVGWLAARLLRLAGATRAAFLNALLLVNSGNYGLSVNLFAFGPAGLALASLVFTISALLVSSLGVYLSASGRAGAREAIKRVAGVPLLYGAVLGLAVNLTGWHVPEPVAKATGLLAQASVPVMLAVLGLKLAETVEGGVQALRPPALVAVALLRLVVSPALAWGLAGLVGLEGLARDVTILQSAMPTAVVTTILATEFETAPRFAALCVLATTLGSLLTVTVILNLLG